MKKFMALLSCIILALAMSVVAVVSAETSPVLSEKNYVPAKADTMDYYGTVGDINETDGGGITTFAHAGFLVPLNGGNISIETQFKLLSKNSVENGGDGVDGWVTYSFSKEPAGDSDKSFPYFGGEKSGVFLHITNYSGTAAPNCVEVLIVQHDGTGTADVTKFFLDNAVDTKINLSLVKAQDNTYTLSFIRLSDNAVLKSQTGLALNSEYFVNGNGQTYFSTAIYEGPGCDEKHWEHRGVALFSAKVYTFDASSAQITLSENEMTYDETVTTYKPDVTVKVGDKTLVNDTDYYLVYENNKAIGTATVNVNYINDYTGNPAVSKTYEIKEAAKQDENGGDEEPEKSNLGLIIGLSVAGAAILAGALIFILNKKKQHN